MRIGIDIGGTKTELAVLDEHGAERLRRREDTPQGDYSLALESLAALVRDAEKELGTQARVGIGLPGLVSPADHRVRNSFATPYNGQPLKADLERKLEREIRIENDANCFTLSEALDGAGSGHALVFGAVLGTGAGGGIVSHGRLLAGVNASAGEWGHNPLPWMTPEEFPGPRCSCGRLGCIEQFVSGSALAADHLRVTGQNLKGRAIVEHAQAGDAAAEASLKRLENRLARALAHVVNLLDPDVIVLGGGLSSLERLYSSVPRAWEEFTYTRKAATRLVQARHGGASGVRGAAFLWAP